MYPWSRRLSFLFLTSIIEKPVIAVPGSIPIILIYYTLSDATEPLSFAL